jgi:hypothetical protein
LALSKTLLRRSLLAGALVALGISSVPLKRHPRGQAVFLFSAPRPHLSR